MGRRSKRHSPPSTIRLALADNVLGLRNKVYVGLPNDTQRNKALAKAANTTLSQIQRIIACTVGVSVDLIELLAKALDCKPQDLLTPYYSNTANPPARQSPVASRQQPVASYL
jgi:DNA-binding Xre family transcriptional regulator